MRNIINHGEQCIKLLHFMLTIGENKNYCRSYEFRQIICPLNEHSQNKQKFYKIFKIRVLKSKKISNYQELIQSDPISCPQNQKGNN